MPRPTARAAPAALATIGAASSRVMTLRISSRMRQMTAWASPSSPPTSRAKSGSTLLQTAVKFWARKTGEPRPTLRLHGRKARELGRCERARHQPLEGGGPSISAESSGLGNSPDWMLRPVDAPISRSAAARAGLEATARERACDNPGAQARGAYRSASARRACCNASGRSGCGVKRHDDTEQQPGARSAVSSRRARRSGSPRSRERTPRSPPGCGSRPRACA
jgi:hypothetical protein